MENLPNSHINKISIGDHLYSTCDDDIAGTVVDLNDVDMTIDFIMYNGSNCFIDDDSEISFLEHKFVNVPLYAPDVLVDYLYKLDDDVNEDFKLAIQLKPVWGGCNRCTASFWILNKNAVDPYYKDMMNNLWAFGQPLPQDYNKYLILK
jgi:hypothetical protein